MYVGRAFAAGLATLVAASVAAWSVAAAVNLYYDFHPVYFVLTAIAAAVAWRLGTICLRALGEAPRLALFAPPVLVTVWIAAGFGLAWWRFPEPGAAARGNRIVLRTLPVYPRARFTHEETWGRYGADYAEEGFVNPPAEWLTTWTWLLPPDADVDVVVAWYVERLRAAGWRVDRNDVGAGTVFLGGERRETSVELDVLAPRDESIGGAARSSVEVDATAGGD